MKYFFMRCTSFKCIDYVITHCKIFELLIMRAYVHAQTAERVLVITESIKFYSRATRRVYVPLDLNQPPLRPLMRLLWMFRKHIGRKQLANNDKVFTGVFI